MALKIEGKPFVKEVDEVDEETGKVEKVRKICIRISNDGNTARKVSATFYYLQYWAVGGNVRKALPKRLGTASGVASATRVITGSTFTSTVYGFAELCIPLGNLPRGASIVVNVGTPADLKGGHIPFVKGSIGKSDPLILQGARQVSALPGRTLRHSVFVGFGLEEEEVELTFDALESMPPGWSLDFPSGLPTGPFPATVELGVRVRPGAGEGETGSVILRTFLAGEETPMETAEVDFVACNPPACAPEPDSAVLFPVFERPVALRAEPAVSEAGDGVDAG